MNLFAAIRARVLAAGGALIPDGMPMAPDEWTRFSVEPARDPAHGDITTNAALIWAGKAGRPPQGLAAALAEGLRADALVASAEAAGAGFVNITLRPEAWAQAVRSILEQGVSRHTPVLGHTVSARNTLNLNDIHESDKSFDEFERGAMRFMTLLRPREPIGVAEATEQTYDNPAFSVQYAHARGRSLFRRARDSFPDLAADPEVRAAVLRAAALERLTDPAEHALMRRLAQYPHVAESAINSDDPQRIAAYLHELANAFHAHSRHGIATPHLRFIIQIDRQLTVARLALVEAVVIILGAGLALLGVEASDEMR